MEDEHSGVDRIETAEQSERDYYLPGVSALSGGPGPVGRFLTSLFRRRGGLRVVVRRKGQ